MARVGPVIPTGVATVVPVGVTTKISLCLKSVISLVSLRMGPPSTQPRELKNPDLASLSTLIAWLVCCCDVKQ